MFAFKPRKEIALNAILIVALLVNSFVSFPVLAQESDPTVTPTPSITETSTETPTPSMTGASTETPTGVHTASPEAAGTRTESPTAEPTTASASSTPAANIQQIDFSRLPLSFVANIGQFDKKVMFQTNSLGGSIFFTTSEVTLVLMDSEVKSKQREDDSSTAKDNSKVVQIEYKNAEKSVVVDGLNLLPGVANFMAGSDKEAWIVNAPTYDGIIYRNLYPGIDLTYEGVEHTLKSTFHVAAGTDPAVINWKYKYAGAVSLDPDGNLMVTLPAQKADQTDTTLIEHTPIAWQEQDGQRLNVPVSYAIAQNGEVSFSFPLGYDSALPLIIDPTLTYSTYLGGVGTDVGNSITTDSAGNVYVAGYSFCTAFPILNPLQGAPAGGQDVIISKINASGNALRYSTCIGGAGDDTGLSIALDAQERIVVGGVTNSTNFPIVGGITTYGGTGGICSASAPCQDVFVLALNTGGSAIRYSTYLGGNGRDEIGDLAVDGNGQVQIVGSTSSTNFPTVNAYDNTFATGGANCSNSAPCYDVTVTRINPDLTGTGAILYSTYLGGVKADKGLGMTVDASGKVYLTGYSESIDYPTLFAEQFERNDYKDIIITVIDTALGGNASLLYSTYFGSHGQDLGYAIALDTGGNVYLTGRTSSDEFHLRDPLQYVSHAGSNCSGSSCYEAFVIKFNISTNSPIYSTFLGGSHNDEGYGIALDSYGRAYVTGYTRSTDFPISNPIQATKGTDGCASPPCADAFLSVLEPDGQSFAYSTFLGGSQDDIGNGLRVDANNQVYLVGETFSTNFPTTPGAYDVSNTETNKRDVFIAKIGALSTAPAAPTTLHLDARILSGNDDAEQSAPGNVYLTNSQMELVRDTTVRTIGLRFAGLNIPQGAEILNAELQFTGDLASAVPTSINLQAQASDNAPAFAATTNNISSRPRTTASVVWTPPDWTVDEESGPKQRTPDLALVVQEVISRPGWVSGNALAVIITGTGSRFVDGYEDNVYDAAYLHIEYSIPTPTPTPTLTSTPTPTKALPPGLSCIDWRDGLSHDWIQSPWVASQAQVVWDANGMHGSAGTNGTYEVGAYFQMPAGGPYKLILNGLNLNGLTVAQGANAPTSSAPLTNVLTLKPDGSYLVNATYVEVKWSIIAPIDLNVTPVFQSFCYILAVATSTPTLTPTPQPCTTWDLASDFRISPVQANPNPDSCNNPGVWKFMGSGGDPRNVANYYLLPNYHADNIGIIGLHTYDTNTLYPHIDYNANNTPLVFDNHITYPSHAINIHPYPGQAGVVAWVSPINGNVSIAGGVSDDDPNGGNGIAWFIDKNSANIASGIQANGATQAFASGTGGLNLSAVAVSTGDTLYFIIDSNGEHYYDNTRVDITINFNSNPPPTPTGPTPTHTVTPTPTLTPTPTSTATPTPSSTPEDYVITIPGWIGSPTQKSIVNGLTPITLANGITLQSGTLDYWPVDDPYDIHTLTTGLGGKTGGQTLGTLDTTTLPNGSYIIHLDGVDSAGVQQDSGIMITVSGEYKPGRVRFTVTDLTIPVAGLPITIARTYDSLERNEVGDFGYGWSLAIGNPKLEKDLAHNVTLTMPDGKRSTFYFQPQPYPQQFGFFMYPQYAPEAGVYGKLEAPDCLVVLSGGKYFCFLEDGEYSPAEYTYTDPYGRKFLMSADGTLKTITDLNNNVLTFTPNGITSSAGNINVPFVRDAQGRITQITYPAGKNYVYGYNASGELDTVTFPTVTQPTQQAIVLHYSYYSGHFFKDATDPRGNKPVITTYDASNRIESVTDAAGNKTTYEYDLDLRKTTIHYLGDPANPTDNLGDAVLIYDSAGYLTNYTDSLGNETIYAYDGNHNLIKITNPLAHETKFTYNADGHPSSIIDPLGKTLASAQYNRYGSPTTLSTAQGGSSNITSTYDASTFMLLTVSDSMGSLGKFTWWPEGTPKTFTNQFGETTNYTYTSEGYLETETDPLGHVTRYSYNNFGQVTEVKTAFGTMDESIARYKYDELNRLIEVTKAFGTNDVATTRYEYDANGNRTAVIDPLDRLTTYQYDDANRLTLVTYAAHSPSEATSTKYIYDIYGQLTDAKIAFGTVDESTTRYIYDSAGRVTDVIAAHGTPAASTAHYVYNTAGNVTDTIIAYGTSDAATIHYAYDAAEHVTDMIIAYGTTDASTTHYTYYDSGLTKSATTAYGTAFAATINYFYDSRGRPTVTQYPDGTTVSQAYDPMPLTPGWSNVTTDQAGVKTKYVYDAAGRLDQLITSTVNPQTGQVFQQASNYEYDAADRLTDAFDPLGNRTSFTYDDAYQMRTSTKWLDATIGYTSIYSYNLAGEQTSFKDANDHTTGYDYNELGLLDTTTYPGNITTSQDYDFAGRPVTFTDENGIVTRNTFDAASRLTSVTLGDGTVDAATTQYGYNFAGQLTSITDALSQVTRFEYNDAGQPVKKIWSNTTSFEQFGYSAAGNMTSHRLADGNTNTYTYNNLNRLTQIAYFDGKYANFTYTNNGQRDTASTRTTFLATPQVTDYDYDLFGRLKQVTVPDGRAVSYTYYDNNQRATMTTSAGASIIGTNTYGYDGLSQLTSISAVIGGSTQTTTFEYDPVGFLTDIHRPNGVNTEYTPNVRNQIDLITHSNSSGVLQSFDYELDNAGNRKKVIETDDSSITWDYDNLYRLKGETRRNGSNAITAQTGFTYDDVGNRLTMTVNGTTTNYGYNNLNQLTSAGTVTYDYDVRGNMWHRTNGSQVTTYTYDAADQLTNVSATGVNATYVYNADGKRVKQSLGSAVTNYLWDEASPYGDVIYEYNNSGATLASYVLAGTQPISQTRSGITNYYLQDGQNSTRALTNSSGAVTDTYAYTAFGESYARTGTTVNPYQYTGQQYDSTTGLYSLRARYYNPAIGRLLTQDVYPHNLGNPIELNRYAYAANSPINFSDPTGYTAFAEYAINMGKGAAVGGLLGGLSDAVIQLLTKPINEFSWNQVLQSTVAGAVSGAFGALTGIGGAAKGLRFTNTVLLGAFDGWLSGMLSRGAMNLFAGNSFFDGYSWHAALMDAFTGGLMSGIFYGVGRAFSHVVDSIPSLSCRANSFSADTTVVTKDGDTPINLIEIGDYVLAWNEETDTLGWYSVTDTIHHTDKTIVHITIDGEELETTPEHPFYVEGKGWVDAEDLQSGDDIRQADGSTGEVESIEIEQTSQEMYNLTVDEAHTFFVGDGQWLVHNACREFDIVQYKTEAPGFEKHHGVMDVWARNNIPGYSKLAAPTMVLKSETHQLTKDFFNDWRIEQTGSLTGYVDWTSMTAQEAQDLSYGMFEYADVPENVIQNYFRQFNKYLYSLP